MTGSRAAKALTGEVALLERAISYTLGNLGDVTPRALTRPTPCREWDLRALLEHMNDSLTALQEASDLGHVALGPVGGASGTAGTSRPADPAAELVGRLRARACQLIGGWAGTALRLAADDVLRDCAAEIPRYVVSVGGLPAPIVLVAAAGAVEIAVHGWDAGQACGHRRPIPAQLATEILDVVPGIVTDADRPARFAEPVPVPAGASPSDRLVAYLGRRPG
jgi:uncharacterized protein (TIGR03086 family)